MASRIDWVMKGKRGGTAREEEKRDEEQKNNKGVKRTK